MEARSAVRRRKRIGTLGPCFSRDAAAAGDGSTKKSAPFISRGGRAPQFFVRSVWHRPADPYRRFGGACCVIGAIGRAKNAESTWDRDRTTRELLIRALTDLVDVYSKAEVTSSPPSVGVPSKSPRNRDDPATHAVSEVILSLLGSVPPPGWEPEIWSPGGSVRWNILRNLERRRGKK